MSLFTLAVVALVVVAGVVVFKLWKSGQAVTGTAVVAGVEADVSAAASSVIAGIQTDITALKADVVALKAKLGL